VSTPYQVSGDAEGRRNHPATVDGGQKEAAPVRNGGSGKVFAHVTMLP
jgi:hypothetical protein